MKLPVSVKAILPGRAALYATASAESPPKAASRGEPDFRTGPVCEWVALIITFAIQPTVFNELGLARWIHILSGITWIGLLYYFNVVQTPGLAAAAADKGGPGGAGVSKYIAPRALAWFRWGAIATWFTGAWYLGRGGNFVNADPDVRARLTGLGMEIPPREQQTPEALVAQQKADIAIWWPVIKAAGIKMQ